MFPIDKVFLHFYDTHYLKEKGVHDLADQLAREARLATRLSILSASQVLLPAASYYESEICKPIIDEYINLIDYGIIWLVANAYNPFEFFENKIIQYDSNSDQKNIYETARRQSCLLPFLKRNRSATKDIKSRWKALLDDSQVPKLFSDCYGISSPKDIEEKWSDIPELLQEKAFIVPYVAPFIFDNSNNLAANNRLHSVINQAYFKSYVIDFDASIVADMVLLEANYPISIKNINIPYRHLLHVLRMKDKLEFVQNCPVLDLLTLRGSQEWSEIFTLAHSIKCSKNLAFHKQFNKSIKQEFNPSLIDRPVVLNITTKEVTMGDKYYAGQVGAQGRFAHVHDMTFNQIWNQNKQQIDLNALAQELATLRNRLKQEIQSVEHDASIGTLAEAEREAKNGNGAKALEYLAKSGKWVLDVANKIGVEVATSALKTSMGL